MERYRIRVKGRLDASWSDCLGGLTISTAGSGTARDTTVLEGPLRDQAALIGALTALYELHLPLLSVEWLDVQGDSRGDVRNHTGERTPKEQ